jgi:predicted N-acetyltransferase YhbS
MDIQIVNLCECSNYVSTVVNWIYSEWGDNNYEYWNSWIRSSLSADKIPMTFGIFVDGKLAGTYSLWRCDLQSRQDLFPWFGGLYVHKDYRGNVYDGKKLGERMIEHAVVQLKKLGYKKAYLFTEKKPSYYIEHGWKLIDVIPDEKDQMVSLCEIEVV